MSNASGGRGFAVCCKGGAGGAGAAICPLLLPYHNDEVTRGRFAAAPSLLHERECLRSCHCDTDDASKALGGRRFAVCCKGGGAAVTAIAIRPMPTPPLVTFSSSPTGKDAWDTLQLLSDNATPGLMMTTSAAGDAQPTSAPLSLSSCWESIRPVATFLCATGSLPHTKGIASP
jgi:hypothetical protein